MNRPLVFFMVLLLALVCAGCSVNPYMSPEEVIRTYYDAIWEKMDSDQTASSTPCTIGSDYLSQSVLLPEGNIHFVPTAKICCGACLRKQVATVQISRLEHGQYAAL
jgi:hypothetical protein